MKTKLINPNIEHTKRQEDIVRYLMSFVGGLGRDTHEKNGLNRDAHEHRVGISRADKWADGDAAVGTLFRISMKLAC